MPAVFDIPAGTPFVDALAAGLRHRLGDAPDALARSVVLLPTRRACRSLREAFLRLGDGRPMLLPRMTPLGDMDEDELAFSGWEEEGPTGGFDAPPAMGGLKRQLLLTRLVLAFREDDITPDQAARLALELGRLLDQAHTERLDFADLKDLVPAEFAAHWRITLKFLSILTAQWPEVLKAEGCVDSALRRNMALEAQAQAWRESPPSGLVVAAGSTGTIPATADLLAVVAGLERGAVVLPGLDRNADAGTWDAIAADQAHPQHGMARLLHRLEIAREDVAEWEAPGVKGTPPARAALANRALGPAETADRWRAGWDMDERALDGVERIDASGPHEEAGAIALAMRHALEVEGRTAALVTPDRALARRVAAELERWGVTVDDSAGAPLNNTPPGVFLRLVARMAAEDLAPAPLLAALKHPLAAGGRAPGAFRARVRELERLVLRGPRPGPGLVGLRAAAENTPAAPLVEELAAALEPFEWMMGSDEADFRDLLRTHIALAEALARSDTESGPERLWAGEAGEAASGFVAELGDAAAVLDPIAPGAYPALFEALGSGRPVRPRYGTHPRLSVLGLMEARLQHADVMILGGLNEGTWPPETPASPWMSRPMMDAFGLPLPERRIGLTAHDFVQAFCAPRVVLSRATRVEGAPTTPSRWLLRLEKLIDGTPLDGLMDGGAAWLRWQGLLDRPDAVLPRPAPQPRPPVGARPRTLSVTRVERWMRNPFGLYAEQILGLRKLDDLDADPGAAEYGTVIHRALEVFLNEYPMGPLPAHALPRLIDIGENAFGAYLDRPGVWAFWWPRFQRVARWFVEVEGLRRDALAKSATEAKGAREFEAPGGPFTLTATADRIDALTDGTLAIIDYKTGAPPPAKEVAAGYAPQLPLEAAIAEAGGFEGVDRAEVSALDYWRLRGTEPAGERRSAGKDVRALIDDAVDGLRRLVGAFDFEKTAYVCRPRPDAAPRYDDYEHLARVREWSAGGGEDGE